MLEHHLGFIATLVTMNLVVHALWWSHWPPRWKCSFTRSPLDNIQSIVLFRWGHEPVDNASITDG